MLQSQLFTKTLKESPKDEKNINAQFLIRGGFIHKEMAGVYTYLPLGLRILKKIENIIREEMEIISGQEILMTVFQPKAIWEKTNRWSTGVGEEMYKCKLNEEEVGLGPTHEEMVTRIAKNFISSYRDLPKFVFQIQTKFRKELRARSGLLRGREFDMKDLYSFHSSEEDLQRYYKKVIVSYHKVLRRCGLNSIITEASGKGFTTGVPHEFQVLAEGGEDTIIFCQNKHFSQNKEIAKFKKGDKCPICKRELKEGRSIEVGNIFPLGIKYSKDLEAYFIDKDGKRKLIIMGCYGLGPSRIMGTIVEVNHDEKGIIWPEEVAPFQIHLIPVPARIGYPPTSSKLWRVAGGENTNKVKRVAEKLYQDIKKQGIEILYDNRKDITPGEKFADCDLIGIPKRLVISERTLKQNCIEIKKRNEKKTKLVKLNRIINYVR